MYLNICASLFFECLTEKLFNRSWSCQSLPFVMLHQAAESMSTWAWRTSAGNWCLDCFRACTGHLRFSISGHLFFFSKWVSVTAIWLMPFTFYTAGFYVLSYPGYLTHLWCLTCFFIPSVNCFFFNSNILLRTICLT